jgi:tetraacyldisaccharide 4'-kinase
VRVSAPADRNERIDQRLARRGGAVELLRPFSALYAGLARLRASGYERGWLARGRVDVPVVSVGNLSAGGTGKTPCVAFLAREFERDGLRVGLLSRGYGAPADSPERENDEARWFARELPALERVQDPDRLAGAARLVERGVDVILLDDGFQHRRLARDLDLVLVDATRPWGLPAAPDGGGYVRACFPRGFLREPPTALARADALVLTRVDQVEPATRAALAAELAGFAPGRPILAGVHRPRALRAPDGTALAPEALHGREVELVSALGNPEGFERSVAALGARVLVHRKFRDHHRYTAADLAGLGAGGRWLVTSEKDAVKLVGLAPVHVLAARFELVEGEAVLTALLHSLPRSRARRERAALHEGLHG